MTAIKSDADAVNLALRLLGEVGSPDFVNRKAEERWLADKTALLQYFYNHPVNQLTFWDRGVAQLSLWVQDHSWAGVLVAVAMDETAAREALKGCESYSDQVELKRLDVTAGTVICNYGDL